MDALWAPWRMEYIHQAHQTADCVFCPMRQVSDDPTQRILWRGEQTLIVMNRYPYNPGHLLIVPYDHTDDLLALTAPAREELTWALGQCVAMVKATLGAAGVNCGMNLGRTAGAGVPGHLHFHVVPRWDGDHNFLPVLGQTKSMPEYLDETYATLAPAFAQLQRGG